MVTVPHKMVRVESILDYGEQTEEVSNMAVVLTVLLNPEGLPSFLIKSQP